MTRLTRPWSAGALAALLLCGAFATPVQAQSLRGSRSSLDRQNAQARQHDFTFLEGPSDLRRFVDAGLLVPLDGGAPYQLHDVSFGVARPEVKLFIERLSAQYHAACGERLVVTSLTRPASRQPSNASSRSVHPTGMAVDLRVPAGACRRWLESTLVSLERERVIEATLERSPLHYHVAVFPSRYVEHVSRLTGQPAPAVVATVQAPSRHTVRRTDTLWDLAKRYGTTPTRIKAANGLRSNVIRPGQVLEIPGR